MIYEKIVEYCTKNGISIMAFEKQCGLSNGTVGKWKDENMNPSYDSIRKIVNATGIPFEVWTDAERRI